MASRETPKRFFQNTHDEHSGCLGCFVWVNCYIPPELYNISCQYIISFAFTAEIHLP